MAVEPGVLQRRGSVRAAHDLEYAPLEERLRTFLERLENVPAYYAAAKANVANPTREHTQLAIEQNRGALAVFGTELERRSRARSCRAAERTVFTQRLAAARAAIEDYVAWLEALDAKLASGAVARAPVPARPRALRAEIRVRHPVRRHGRGALRARRWPRKRRCSRAWRCSRISLWPKYFPKRGAARRSLRQDRPRDREAVGAARRARGARRGRQASRSRSSSAGCASTTCSTLDPTKPLTVRETPPHKRGIAGASIDAPGPYDPGAPTYYNVTPLDDLSAGARRELAARVQRLDAADPEHPRGGARPLRAARLREQVAEPDQERSSATAR